MATFGQDDARSTPATFGQADAAYPAQEQPDLSADTSRARARSVLQGVSLGFGDEITAALGAAVAKLAGDETPVGDIYRNIRDVERAEQEQFRAARPGLSTALEVGGGLLTGGLGASRLAGSQVAQRVAQMPLRNRMLAASAGGAAGGAVTGAGEAETMVDIPAQAARAAIPGAVLGPLAELGGTAVGRMMQAMGPQRAAERTVARAVERSGLSPAEAAQRMGALGPEAALADVGEGTVAALETAANQPGVTMRAAERQLGRRSRQQAAEVTERMGPGRVIEMGERLAEQRRTMAGPLYEQAMGEGVQNTSTLREILGQSDAVQSAWRTARRKGRDEAVAQGMTLDPRMLGTEAEPSLQGWQAITMQLNDAIETARRGARPRPSEVRRLTRIRDRINAELDAQNPTYASARALWSGSKDFEDAMERGRQFFKESSAVKVKELRDLPDAQRAAYRVGVAQAMQDRLEKMGDLHDVTRLFRNEGMRRKMRALFETPEDYAEFMNRIEAAWAKQRTMNRVLGNSATARRLAAAEEESLGPALAGAAVDVATGTPVQTVAGGGLRSLTKRIPTSREATRNRVGQMLLETDPTQINRMLQLLESGGTPYQRTASGFGVPFALGVGGGTLLPPEQR